MKHGMVVAKDIYIYIYWSCNLLVIGINIVEESYNQFLISDINHEWPSALGDIQAQYIYINIYIFPAAGPNTGFQIHK